MDMSSHPLLSAVDEPPHFPASYPQLRRLDRSMVCQICKEPFTGPVTISCGHSFCSLCIRSSLEVMKKCPSCNETVTEGSIRRNRALEEMVDAWEESRPTIIDLAQPPRKRPAPAEATHPKPSSSTGVKRARLSPTGSANADANANANASGSRSGSPTKSRRASDAGNDEHDGDEDQDDIFELTENDEAPCPLCQASMPISSIPLHIEKGCPPPKPKSKNNGTLGKGNQKADWKKVFSGQGLGGKGKEVEMKRITKPNYALSSPADLRAILAEYSLPTTGDKPTLQSRLQEWIILFNSNLDTSHPSSLSALRAKLAESESSRRRDKEKGKDEVINQLASKDGLAKYASDKKGEFERLRREIMERDKRRKEADEGKGRGGRDNAIEVE
ncbi:DNA repair protein rad18 [Kwoniella sp. CBS 9459]